MDRATFEEVVREALDALPEEFAARLHNLEVLIEDEPSPELLRSLGLSPRHNTLFGLYRGVPLKRRNAWFGNQLPDTITIFYRPLVHAFRTTERVRTEVQRTVIHEIAHYIGMSESEIRRLGY